MSRVVLIRRKRVLISFFHVCDQPPPESSLSQRARVAQSTRTRCQNRTDIPTPRIALLCSAEQPLPEKKHSDHAPPLPLWPVLVAYPAFSAWLALVSLVDPRLVLAAALVASPALALPLGVHALSVEASAQVPAQLRLLACACACVAVLPLACWLAHPWALWAASVAFSCFFLLATPRGVLFRASACSCGLVLLSAGLVAAQAPGRVVWGAVVLALTLQSVAAAARLRYATLHCSVSDVMGRARGPEPYI